MSNLTPKEQWPLFLAFAGFGVCALSFIIAATIGKSLVVTILFYPGFSITAIGVLIGFFTFKQDV